ncbi:MAG: hypothetical protein GXN92_01335, partial [Candidatus Micrarchaeota archaeon]|nr:hypothetical protein [Candidatus Micrarchaeota archaeon]
MWWFLLLMVGTAAGWNDVLVKYNGTVYELVSPLEVLTAYSILSNLTPLYGENSTNWEKALYYLNQSAEAAPYCRELPWEWFICKPYHTFSLYVVLETRLSSQATLKSIYEDPMWRDFYLFFGYEIVKQETTYVDPETNETWVKESYTYNYVGGEKCEPFDAGRLAQLILYYYPVSVVTPFPPLLIALIIQLYNIEDYLIRSFLSYWACADMVENYNRSLYYLSLYLEDKERVYNQTVAEFLESYQNFTAEGGCEVFPQYCNISINRLRPLLTVVSFRGNG